jgi:3D (Asp-Asp-Asp) domain-containing protein
MTLLSLLLSFQLSQPIPQLPLHEQRPVIHVPVERKKLTVAKSLGSLATVTAYSEYDSCHTGSTCLMASGKKAYVGAIACPRKYKLGTRVVIDTTPYICEDRTATSVDGRFDIFYGYGQEAYDKAIQFGKQTKTITIINNGL